MQRNYSKKDYIIVCIVFSIFAIMATYTGLDVEGSLVNVRTITIVSGGIIFGPVVGSVTGLISGVHRFLIDIGGVTSIQCLISSIIAGVISGYINKRINKRINRRYTWIAGIIAGMFSETITMILILLLSKAYSLGYEESVQIMRNRQPLYKINKKCSLNL